MFPEVVVTLLSASLAYFLYELILAAWKTLLRRYRPGEFSETYSAKLERLIANLVKASSEVDEILAEISRIVKEKESALKTVNLQLSELMQKETELRQQFETRLKDLETREQELKLRNEQLENTPLPVADYFAQLNTKLTENSEKRSARRDYLLFIAGVIVSILVTLVLANLGFGI